MKQLIAITFALAVFGTPAAAQCSDADKKALQDLDQAWGKAEDTGDRNAIINVYADDFVVVPAMTGKTAAVEGAMLSFERRKANPHAAEIGTSDHYSISCTPVTATILHRVVTRRPGEKPEVTYSRAIHFLEKRNGQWKVVSSAGNPLNEFGIIFYSQQDWATAEVQRNKAWFEENLAPEYTIVRAEDGTLANKEKFMDSIMGGRIDSARITDLSIRIDGNAAVANGVYHVSGKDEKGVPYERRYRYADSYIKRDGRWLAWSTAGTRIPEPGGIANKK